MKKVLLTLSLLSSLMMAADGAALYKKCASCHGASGEKKALGKSQVISQMSTEELTTALTGYKDGSYGASMKALMKSQVANLSNDDITALAEHITSLK